MSSKSQKFEDALARLEEIVERMESGDIDLDKSLALFEEGVKLVRQCSARLEESKRKVEILVKKSGGNLSPEPFDPESDEEDTSGQ